MRRWFLALILATAFIFVAAPAAHAASANVTAAQSVAPSSDTCQVGQVCEVDQTVPNFTNEQKLPKGADPPGHMLRSLIMLIILAALFVAYALWAFQGGTRPAS